MGMGIPLAHVCAVQDAVGAGAGASGRLIARNVPQRFSGEVRCRGAVAGQGLCSPPHG